MGKCIVWDRNAQEFVLGIEYRCRNCWAETLCEPKYEELLTQTTCPECGATDWEKIPDEEDEE